MPILPGPGSPPTLTPRSRGFTDAYQLVIMGDTPIGPPIVYYRLGEGGSVAYNAMGGGRDGAYSATGITQHVAGGIVQDDGAASFDGVAGNITTTGYNPWSGSITISAWVKTNNYAGSSSAIAGSNGATNPTFSISSSGTVAFFYSGASGISWTGAWPGDNQWVHVVLTFDPVTIGNCHLYINNVSQGTPSGSTGAYGATNNLSIGSRGSALATFMNGSIDEFAMWSGILGPAYVNLQYQTGRPDATGDYETEVLADSPQVYYRLNDSARDYSGHSRDGVSTGVTYGVSAGIDDADNAASFDGSASRIYSTGYNPWSGSVTVEAWVKTDAYATGGTKCIVGSEADNPSLSILANGNIEFFYSGLGGVSWTGAWATIGDNRWCHVVATFDPTNTANCNLWLDSKNYGVSGTAAGSYGTTGNVTIGARQASPSTFFPGDIDEVAVYSSLLSDTRIRVHYATGVRTRDPFYAAIKDLGFGSLAAHYRCDENDATQNILYDSTALANHATITGGLGTVGRGLTGGTLDANNLATSFDGATDYATASFSPFVLGSQRTFVMVLRRDSISADITNIFCGEGSYVAGVSDDMKLPVLEWCPAGSGGTPNDSIRWYASVDRDFPIYQDWPVSLINAGEWHLLVLRVDDSQTGVGDIGSALDLSIDGQPLGPPTIGAAGTPSTYKGWESTAGKFMFGVRHNAVGAQQANEYSDATYDEVAIFNRWLTDDEVVHIANAMGSFTVVLQSSTASSTSSLSLTAPAKISLTSAGVSTTSLALSAQTQVPLGTSAAVATTAVALTAKTQVALSSSDAVSATTLALTAKTRVVLSTSDASATTTLAITAQTQIPLGTSAATASPSLALSAKTTIPLGASAAVATPTLALAQYVLLGTSAAVASSTLAITAQTQIPLGTSAATTLSTLALTAPTQVVLSTSVASTTTSLFVTALTQIPLSTSAGIATASLAIMAKTQIPLDASNGVASPTLALSAQTQIPLGTSAAVALPTLNISAQTTVALGTASSATTTSLALTAPALITMTSAGTSTSALALTAPALLTLASAGLATTSLALSAKTSIPLATSAAVASPTLALSAQTQIPLATSAALATPTLALTAQTTIALATTSGASSATLSLTATALVTLSSSSSVSVSTLALTAPTQVPLSTSDSVATTSIFINNGGNVVSPLNAAAVSTASMSLSAAVILDFRAVNTSTYKNQIIADAPLAYWALDANTGVTDLMSGGHDGTAAGGVTVGGAAGWAGTITGTTFDGSDDHITTTWGSRENLCTNPKAGSNALTNLTNVGLATFETAGTGGAVALPTLTGLPSGVTTGVHCIGGDNVDAVETNSFTVVNGGIYTISVYVYWKVTGGATRVEIAQGSGSSTGTATVPSGTVRVNTGDVGTWKRVSMGWAATSGGTFNVRIRQITAGAGCEWFVTAILSEVTSVTNTPTAYFDGDTSTDAGWQGTTNLSKSSVGPFANGLTRSYEGWVKRANTSAQHAILGGDGTANIPQLTLESGSNDVKWRASGGAAAGLTWTNAWPPAAQYDHVMLVTPIGTSAALYVNGGLISSQADTDTIQTSTAGNFAIGELKGSTSPFAGSMAHLAVYNGDKSALAPIHYNYGNASAMGVASGTLALTATTQVALNASAGVATTTLALTAPSVVSPLSSAGSSTAALTLTAASRLTLTSAGVATTGALALSAQTRIPLGAASGTSTAAALSLSAQTQIPLGTSAAVATSSLALSAKTELALNASAAVSGTLILVTNRSQVALDTSAATSTTALTLTARALLSLTSSGVATTTLHLQALTQIPLGTGAAASTTSLALRAKTAIPLQTSHAVATPTLALSVQTRVRLNASAATASTSIALKVKTALGLNASDANSTAALTLTAKALLSLTSNASSTTALHLSAHTGIPLDTSEVTSSATLNLKARTQVVLDGSHATSSTTTLQIVVAERLSLESHATASASLHLGTSTRIPLNASHANATSHLGLRAQTLVALGQSSATSGARILHLFAPRVLRDPEVALWSEETVRYHSLDHNAEVLAVWTETVHIRSYETQEQLIVESDEQIVVNTPRVEYALQTTTDDNRRKTLFIEDDTIGQITPTG